MKRIFAVAALAAAFAAFAPAANAYITTSDGGSASVSVNCNSVFGGAQAWAGTLSLTSFTVHYRLYIYSATYPARSSWLNGGRWSLMVPGTSQQIGNVATRGSGLVAVYAEYAIFNAGRWSYAGEWLVFNNTNSLYCNV